MSDKQASVAAQVAALPSLPMPELWSLWDRFFPRRPDKTNRVYLESRVAYKLQEEAFGGLDSDTRRRLVNIGIRHSKIKERRKAREITLAPGTVLVREWGERDHRVKVTAEGTFEYEGRQFKSLSAVARHIAGSPWSGPLFFGLRRAGEGYE
jgi:hypothetical protein